MRNLYGNECWLLDMDGTIYLGNRLIDGAPEFLRAIRRGGGRYAFLTNNSSASPEDYAEKLTRLGIAASPAEIFTSGDAAGLHLAEISKGGSPRVFVLGTPALERQLSGYGIELVKEEPDFVLLGFDKTLTYEKINAACRHIWAGTPFFATHPDLLCPVENGSVPDTGSMIKMFEAATGVSPVIIGKPEPIMAAAALKRFDARPESAVMVGDRLSTDIAFANRAGLGAALVLSGETDMETYGGQSGVWADWIFPSVKELAAALSGEQAKKA